MAPTDTPHSSEHTDAAAPAPVPYPGTLTNSINATSEDVGTLDWALASGGVAAATDPSGRLMDFWYQTDAPQDVARLATKTLLGHADNQVAALVAGDDCLHLDGSGTANFAVNELAGAVRWCEAYARALPHDSAS
jgi:hypothetical protein